MISRKEAKAAEHTVEQMGLTMVESDRIEAELRRELASLQAKQQEKGPTLGPNNRDLSPKREARDKKRAAIRKERGQVLYSTCSFCICIPFLKPFSMKVYSISIILFNIKLTHPPTHPFLVESNRGQRMRRGKLIIPTGRIRQGEQGEGRFAEARRA